MTQPVNNVNDSSPQAASHTAVESTPSDQQLPLDLRANEGSAEVEEGRVIHHLPAKKLKQLLSNIHPACSSFEVQDHNVQRLIDSLKLSGPRHPIEILDHQLLDGRTRVLAALELKISLPAIYLSPDDLGGLSPFQYALRSNRAADCGRHLTSLQIGLAALRYHRKWFDEQRAAAKLRQQSGVVISKEQSGQVLKLAAKQFGISTHCLYVAGQVVAADDERLFDLAYIGRLSQAAILRIVSSSGEIDAAITAELNSLSARHPRRALQTRRTPAQVAEDLRFETEKLEKVLLRAEQVLKSNADVAFDLAPLRHEIAKLNGFIVRLALQFSSQQH